MQAAFRKSCIDCLNIEKCNFQFAGMLQNPFGTIGRASIHGHALYVRSVRRTARTPECLGCFASLHSVQGSASFTVLRTTPEGPGGESGGKRHRASPMNGQSVPAYLPPGPAKRKGLRSLNNAMGNLFLTGRANNFFAREAPFSNLPAIGNGELPPSPFQTPRSFMNGTCRPANARRPPACFSAGLSPCRNAFRCFPMDGFSCPAAPSSHADAWIPLVKLSNLRYSEKRKNGRRLRAASSFLKAGPG